MRSKSPTSGSLGSRPRLLTGRSFSPRRAAKDPNDPLVTSFREVVWEYWKESGRHELPWRKTKDAYRILVSEMMLQQTQVSRVLEKYSKFVKRFPNVRSLANAELRDVLRLWSGLGYNRRGKYLYEAARKIVDECGGFVPKGAVPLQKLPGIGPYTASAIRVFAFNEPDVLIETNIRTAIFHHFFPHPFRTRRVLNGCLEDKKLIPYVRIAAQGQDPRTWNWALMDYGAHLKRMGIRNNHQSAHYAKQSKFEGSLRQVRGAILRALTQGEMIAIRSQSLNKALEGLSQDGLIVKEKGEWRIA